MTCTVLLAVFTLGSCNGLAGNDEMDRYFQRSDTITLSAGDAKQANAVTHTIHPWPRNVGDRRIAYDARRVGAAVMFRRDLDVVVVPMAVWFLVLDACIGEVHLVIEVRQLVFERPVPNLFVSPIRVSVVIIAVAVPLMQPLLVVALELMIEDDAIDARAALREALCRPFVRAIDLQVVLKLSFAFQAIPERLAARLVAITMTFEKAAALLRERHSMLARARHPNGLDQPLLAQMSKIARARIGWPIVMISEITTGDHSKRTDRRERPRLRPA